MLRLLAHLREGGGPAWWSSLAIHSPVVSRSRAVSRAQARSAASGATSSLARDQVSPPPPAAFTRTAMHEGPTAQDTSGAAEAKAAQLGNMLY